MTKKIWNVSYIVGNPAMFKKITTDARSPMTRAQALAGAAHVAGNGGGWRVWVEHAESGERIFESEAEVVYRKKEALELAGIEFGEFKMVGGKDVTGFSWRAPTDESEVCWSTLAEAVNDAWGGAVVSVCAKHDIEAKHWPAKPFGKQLELVADLMDSHV